MKWEINVFISQVFQAVKSYAVIYKYIDIKTKLLLTILEITLDLHDLQVNNMLVQALLVT